MWWNQSSIPINTGLNLKTRFAWEKKKHVRTNEVSSIFFFLFFFCNVLWSAGSNFCAIYNSPGTFVGFCFIRFTQVLIKELERILILVRKIFNCMVSFKILLWRCLINFKKELWTSLWSSSFQNSIFGNTSIRVWKPFLSKSPISR